MRNAFRFLTTFCVLNLEWFLDIRQETEGEREGLRQGAYTQIIVFFYCIPDQRNIDEVMTFPSKLWLDYVLSLPLQLALLHQQKATTEADDSDVDLDLDPWESVHADAIYALPPAHIPLHTITRRHKEYMYNEALETKLCSRAIILSIWSIVPLLSVMNMIIAWSSESRAEHDGPGWLAECERWKLKGASMPIQREETDTNSPSAARIEER